MHREPRHHLPATGQLPAEAAPILDTADPVAVAAYERAFHDAFAGIGPGLPLRRLWVWDDAARRVRSPVPYDEQIVYADCCPGSAVRRGLAINVACRRQQAAAFGFRLPPGGPDTAEILTFFADGDNELAHLIAFWQRCCRDLQARGILTGYGTCARRPLPVYRRLGARILDRTEVDGEARFLLRFDFRRTWFVQRREAAPRAPIPVAA